MTPSSNASHWVVDASDCSVVVRCECGARFLAGRREPAMRALAGHLARAHSRELAQRALSGERKAQAL